jgi:hypothetical protein
VYQTLNNEGIPASFGINGPRADCSIFSLFDSSKEDIDAAIAIGFVMCAVAFLAVVEVLPMPRLRAHEGQREKSGKFSRP